MTTSFKLNFIFEPNIETFYLDLINALFSKRFQTLEQVDNFLDEFITTELLKGVSKKWEHIQLNLLLKKQDLLIH